MKIATLFEARNRDLIVVMGKGLQLDFTANYIKREVPSTRKSGANAFQ